MSPTAMALQADDAPTIANGKEPDMPQLPPATDSAPGLVPRDPAQGARATTSRSWPPSAPGTPPSEGIVDPGLVPAPTAAGAPLGTDAAPAAHYGAPPAHDSTPGLIEPLSGAYPQLSLGPTAVGDTGRGLPGAHPLPPAPPASTAMASVGQPPTWVWGMTAGVFVVGALLGFLGGWFTGGSDGSSAPSPSASHSAAPTTASAPTAPPKEPTPLEKVAAGDEAAIKALEEEPFEQRTAAEAIALARGRTARKRAEIAKLGETLSSSPDLAENPQMLKRLRKHAMDPELAEQVLGLVASLPGSGGADLLYDVWFRTPKRRPMAKLAEELLYSKDVRAKASPALSVVLDLRLEKDCDKVLEIVARAEEHGDRRCLIPLGRLVPKVGCGERKVSDCYACLGNRAQVRDAITAARRRPIPVF